MAADETGFPKSNELRRPGTFSWIATILVCIYLAWIAVSLYRSTAAFSSLYISLNVTLPAPTWFVIHTYQWFYPCLFGGLAALVIAKQFRGYQKWVNLTVTLAAVVVLEVLSNGIVRALYLPLFDIVEKLK